MVDWRACLDPCADHLEIRSSHVGMAVNADSYRAVADALAGFRKPARGRARKPQPRAARQPSLRRAA